MILFPAIDLMGGVCVRLVGGRMDHATVYNTDPASQARSFAKSGFEWLHVVDLDGAVAGRPVNGEAVEAVLKAVDLPVQLGGGIRDLERIEYWLERGVKRVILGTVAVRQPDLVKEACRRYPGKIVVGIDSRDGYVAVEGWAETSAVKALDLALRFEESGVAAIVYTDITRDGAMAGLNVEATADLAWALTTPVIASGGVASIADLHDLKDAQAPGIEGVICGRALYDGRIEPKAALKLLREKA